MIAATAPFLHPLRACARRRDGREPRQNYGCVAQRGPRLSRRNCATIFFEGRKAEQSSLAYRFEGGILTEATDTTWSAARQPRQGAPHAGNQASGRSGPTARSSRRSRRISSPWSIIIRTLRLLARPLKRSSCNCGAAIAGRVVLHNRSSAAALGLRGAVHKRGSSEKTAHPYSGPSVTRHRAPFRFEVQSAARAVRPAHRATGWLDFRWVFRALASLLAAVYGENRSRAR